MNTVEAVKKEVSITGQIPIGSIIAWFPRLFHETTPNTVDTDNRVYLTEDWAKCDGRRLSDYDGSLSDSDYQYNPKHSDSPLINGSFNRVPNLTDDRFLIGNFTIGVIPLGAGGNGDNSITIAEANLPPHIHGKGTIHIPANPALKTGDDAPDHAHTANVWDNGAGGPDNYFHHSDPNNGYFGKAWTDGATTRHQHTFSVATEYFAGSTDNGGFTNNSINILPKYLKCIYIMRVK